MDSVEGVQLICCVFAWDLILPSIEMTQIIEAVVVECHGCYPFLIMHPCGSVMSSSAMFGIQMVMVVNVVMVKGESYVLIPTSGRNTAETTRTDNRGGDCQMAWELRFKFPSIEKIKDSS